MASFSRWILLIFGWILALQGLMAQPKNLIIKIKSAHKITFPEGKLGVSDLLAKLGSGEISKRFPRHQSPDERTRMLGKPLVDLSLIYHCSLPENVVNDFVLQQIRKFQEVEYAEWEEKDAIPLFNPNDPRADSLSGNQRQILRLIKAYQAWNLHHGDTNVVIGILDTGVPVLHEDMAAQIKINPLDPPNGIDDDGNGMIDDFQGWDFGNWDNNPTPDNTGTAPGHGTSVSSLAAAATHNGKGIAGIGFKCKILPLKVWKWDNGFSNFRGYDALVYAADMGCKVINCSWGSARSGNQFEQDIISYATLNKGSLVVAAGGNTQGYYHFVPACYQGVLGVSMCDSLDKIVLNSSQHYKLDVIAPGVGVFGIKTDNSYGWVEGGSSMASPMVAGAVALVRAKYPNLNGLQAGEVIRVNTDSIYQVTGNAPFRDRSGRGRLNIQKALQMAQSISLRPGELEIRNKKGLQAQAGDTIFLYTRFDNYLDSVSGFEAQASSSSSKIQFIQSSKNYEALGSLQSRWETVPFVAVVGQNVNPAEDIHFKIQVKVGNQYQDHQWFIRYLNGRILDLDSNEIQLTVTSNGRLGFLDNGNYVGSGIRYKGSQYCGEAGLMIGTGPTKVSNAVFNTTNKDDHFRIENPIDFKPFPAISQHAVNHANDSAAGVRTIGISFKQSSYELTDDSLRGSVFFNYQVKNNNSTPLDSICLAHYNDWDIENFNQNFAIWDSSLQLGYSYSKLPKNKFAGVQILTGGEPQFYAIDALNNTNNGNINLFDGYSWAEKWQTMSRGIARANAGNQPVGNNVVTVTGVKWRNFQPGSVKKVALAYVFGDSLAQLKARASANLAYFRKLHTSPSPLPKEWSFCQDDTIYDGFEMAGIHQFQVSKYPEMSTPIYSGTNFSAIITTDSSFYVAGTDSLFPGAPAHWQYHLVPTPTPSYTFEPFFSNDSIPVGVEVTFSVNDSSTQWFNRWAINGLTQLDTTFSISRIFDQTGTVTVCLQQMHRTAGCQGLFCKNFKVFDPLSIRKGILPEKIKIFKDGLGKIRVSSSHPIGSFFLTDALGRIMFQTKENAASSSKFSISIQNLSNGIYFWKGTIHGKPENGKILIQN